MRETALLTALELRSLWGINRARHTRDKKERRRFALLGAVWLLVLGMLCSYVWLLVTGLCALGLGEVVTAYLGVIACVLLFVLGIFRDGNVLFSRRSYDMLLSLPLPAGAIVGSRFLRLYVENLLFTLAVFLPGLVAYGMAVEPSVMYYLAVLAGVVLLPLLPLSLSAAVGTAILAVSSRMRHKAAAQTVLSLLLVVAVLVASPLLGARAEALTPEMLKQLATLVSDAIGSLYPPAMWLNRAALGELTALLWLLLVSLAGTAVLLWWVSRYFRPISTRLQTTSARHDYALTEQRAASLFRALYAREWKRYFGSSIYVINTIIGPVMAVGLAVAVAVAGTDALAAVGLPVDIPPLLPFVTAATLAMMAPTACSLSLEGREVWLVQTLPIPMEKLLLAKMALHLSLWSPFLLASSAILAVALAPGALETVWLFLLPLSFTVFASAFGLATDVHLHRFDWEREEAVVKQGAASMVGGLVPALVAVVAAFGAAAVPPALGTAYRAAVTAVVLLSAWALYRHCCGTRFEKL